MYNGNVLQKDLKDKIIFWDIDGTLAPYRFNNHLGDPDGSDNGMSLKEIDEHIFLERQPSKFMQKVIKTCLAKKHIIMGHCQNRQEMSDKEVWLAEHFPIINEVFLLLQTTSKADTILNYCKENNIDLQDIVFVDDSLTILREAERKGITSYHISSFLDWDYQELIHKEV